MKDKILKITILLLALFIGLIAIFILPDMAKLMASSLTEFSFLRKPGLTLIYLSLVPFYISLVPIWKLINLAYKQEIFTLEAISFLKIIRMCSFSIFVIYAFALFILILLEVPFTNAYLTIIILLLSALAFYLALSLTIRLVNTARVYKEENELTI